MDLLRDGGRERPGVDHAHSVDGAAARQGRIHPRDPGRRGVGVGRRHLRGPPGGRVDHADAGEVGGVEVGVSDHVLVSGKATGSGSLVPEGPPVPLGPEERLPLGPQELGHAGVLGGGKPDVHVCRERARDLAAQHRAHRHAGDPPDDLTGQEPERVRVVAVPRSRRPPRRLGGERADHHEHAAVRHRSPERRKAGLVAEQLPQRHGRLARGPELRPVPGYRCVGVEPILADQPGHARGDQPLAHREHVDQRVLLPWPVLLMVGPAAPEIRDHGPAHRQARRGSGLAALGEVGGEGVTQGGEARFAPAADRRPAHLPATIHCGSHSTTAGRHPCQYGQPGAVHRLLRTVTK